MPGGSAQGKMYPTPPNSKSFENIPGIFSPLTCYKKVIPASPELLVITLGHKIAGRYRALFITFFP